MSFPKVDFGSIGASRQSLPYEASTNWSGSLSSSWLQASDEGSDTNFDQRLLSLVGHASSLSAGRAVRVTKRSILSDDDHLGRFLEYWSAFIFNKLD